MSKRTSIRIPDDLYILLVERAKNEQRTISNLIVSLLVQSIDKPQNRSHSPATNEKGEPL